MIDFDVLLDIQAHDTQAEQIRHRRSQLPERAELASIAEELAVLAAAAAEAEGRRAELARHEKRFEDEAQLVEDKATRERERLYSGEIKVPKELQAIQDEIEGLKRRQTELEDEAIALMEQIEPVAAELARSAEKRVQLEERQDATQQRLGEAEAAADAELAESERERVELAQKLEPEVLETYEKVRAAQGGVAVSRLVGSTCDGCHLGLSAVELDRVKHEPADVLVYHEECGRILVR